MTKITANTDIDITIAIDKFKYLIQKPNKDENEYIVLHNLLKIILSQPEYVEQNKALNQYLCNLVRYNELRNKPCEELTSDERVEETELAVILRIPSH